MTLHHSPPTAESAARRRARHLLRAPGARDELVKHDGLRCAQPLPKGTVFEAVRFGDFSYGAGQSKAKGDPIVSVYQKAHGVGFVDDFDRRQQQQHGGSSSLTGW